MLTEDQLVNILKKEELKLKDVMLLHHHLDAIAEVQDEYGENTPIDVDMALMNDCERIIVRLKTHLISKGIFKLP